MTDQEYLERLKAERAELAAVVPQFKPQYGTKYKSHTLREIAQHSNFFEIEIHPNIVSELIDRERLDRANAYVKGQLAKLTTAELNDLQIEVNLMMFDQQIALVEERLKSVENISFSEGGVVSGSTILGNDQELVVESEPKLAADPVEVIAPKKRGKK